MATLTQQGATVDRQQASKLLRVSVRTVDRYIKSGRLPAYQKSGRIWLRKSDVVDLSKGTLITTPVETQPVNVIRGTAARGTSQFSTPTQATATETEQLVDGNFYKDLYEEAQKKLNEYQKKNDQTQSRITDLETQIMRFTSQQGMIATNIATQTQMQTQNTRYNDGAEGYKVELLKKETQEKDENLKILKDLFEKEKANKTAFAIITYTLLALQPVFWWLLK